MNTFRVHKFVFDPNTDAFPQWFQDERIVVDAFYDSVVEEVDVNTDAIYNELWENLLYVRSLQKLKVKRVIQLTLKNMEAAVRIAGHSFNMLETGDLFRQLPYTRGEIWAVLMDHSNVALPKSLRPSVTIPLAYVIMYTAEDGQLVYFDGVWQSVYGRFLSQYFENIGLQNPFERAIAYRLVSFALAKSFSNAQVLVTTALWPTLDFFLNKCNLQVWQLTELNTEEQEYTEAEKRKVRQQNQELLDQHLNPKYHKYINVQGSPYLGPMIYDVRDFINLQEQSTNRLCFTYYKKDERIQNLNVDTKLACTLCGKQANYKADKQLFCSTACYKQFY